MCGFAGLFVPRGNIPPAVNVRAMTNAIRHRGPDGEGFHASDDKRFQVGFRRLAIIDLDTGDQPLVAEGGARVLVGNGEVYNYLELRAEMADYAYVTRGDMEAVLAAHRRDGEDFVHALNGMYGLALFERDVHRLTLVRDRLGVKPLYWTQRPDGIVLFASEIKALFASALINVTVDSAQASSYLAHGWVPAPRTLFRGINKLPPGHKLTVDADGTVHMKRYWRPVGGRDLPPDPVALGRVLIDQLKASVGLQLRSDVPLGALLSGGIDSGLLVALAAEQSSGPLNTFTVRFPGDAVDESPLAGAVAERYGTRHETIDVPPGDVGALLPTLAWQAEEPLYDAALLPNYRIEQVLGQHVTVALNGSGGDELFAGYGRYFPLPVEIRYAWMPGWLRRGVIEPLVGAVDPMKAFQLSRAALFGADRGLYLHAHIGHFPPPIRRLIGNGQTLPEPAQCAPFMAFNGEPQTAALAADLETYLADDLMVLLDRTSMAWGVEGRVPFLDHDMVECALSVPAAVRTPAGRQKGLLRDLARPYLPEAVIRAPKQGFRSPVLQWLDAGLTGPAKALLTSSEALERGWWTAEGIGRLFADPSRHGFRVYTLLMLELAVRTAGLAAPPGHLEDLL